MFITDQPISTEEFLNGVPDPSCGASVIFEGIVRNHQNGKPVEKLYYECYESLANHQIGLIVDEVKKRYGVDHIRVLHRIGWLKVGDVAVVVEVRAAHREEAFQACRAVIDEIKKKVPIWKKEVFTDGSSEWVLPRISCMEDYSETGGPADDDIFTDLGEL